MRKMSKVILYFLILTFAVLMSHVTVMAQIQIPYPYTQYSPITSSQSMWMPFWSYPYSLGGRMNPTANPLNYNYLYLPFNPINLSGIPTWTFPWDYFHKTSPKPEPEKPPLEDPKIIRMGPLSAQLFEPYRYLFIADYTGADIEIQDEKGNVKVCANLFEIMLDPDQFITDPNKISAYWISLGADPNMFITDHDEWKYWGRYPYKIDAEPDPNISALMGRDFAVDINLPILADPNLRLGGAKARRLINQGILDWDLMIRGFDSNELQFIELKTLPIYPYDGMPTYLTSNDSGLEALVRYGRSYYNPTLVFLLESALWNAGLTKWPNIAALDFTPQYFEDLIVTIEVSNGIESDVTTFPISVVNYPVENYPPVVCQPVEDQTFYVGEANQYLVNFIDPDSFIFSMSPAPATTHTPAIAGAFRTDMDGLSFGLKIKGFIRGCPWRGDCLQPSTNLVTWVPKFEGVYNDVILSCADARGGTSFVEFTILGVKR